MIILYKIALFWGAFYTKLSENPMVFVKRANSDPKIDAIHGFLYKKIFKSVKIVKIAPLALRT